MKQIPPLQIHQEHWDLMLADVSTRSPEEACGILAGTNFRRRFPGRQPRTGEPGTGCVMAKGNQ